MNQHKKVLPVFILLTLITFWSSLTVSAQSGTGYSEPYFPDLSSTASSQAPPAASSSKASSSSRPASSVNRSSLPSSSSKTESKAASSYPNSYYGSSSVASGDVLGRTSSAVPSSQISLPSVSAVSENDPLESVATNTESTHKLNWIGLLAWGCIALGVIVVLIVVFSNRRPPRGMSRKRYRRPGRSRKKRLLNDKYYRHIGRY